MNPETLSKLSELGLQYGPFFFALLFLAIIPRWPYRIFKETNAKKDPPATPAELTSARVVFLVTFFFGLGLVAISVGWWLKSPPRIYSFQGEIVDLHDYELLASASDKLYFRPEPRPDIDGIPVRYEHFVVVQDTPFAKGQMFEVEFSKNKSARNLFRIPYTPGAADARFRVNWDDTVHTNVLQPDAAVAAESHGFVWTAHAGQASIPVYQGRPAKSQTAKMAAPSPIAVLQDSNSDVGSKIVALDQLDKMPASVLSDQGTEKEPALATLLDLTRYSDKEVSYKAELLIKKVNVDDYVAGKLSSSQAKDQHEGQQVLLKMEKSDSERVLAKLKPQRASQLQETVSQAANYRVIPTPSAQGDRYYVRATWDAANARTVECLTNLFHAELINSRSIEQERTIMKDRSQRLVYWYDKQWTIEMAAKIRACGGNAAFVEAGVKK